MKIQTQDKAPRERILATAQALFYRQGYHATGINQIIKEAKVAKASFYDHFNSKEALGLAYLQQTRAQTNQRRQSFIEQYSDPKARVLALFDFLEAWLKDTNFRGCEFLNIMPEFPERNSVVRHEIVKHKSDLRAYIHHLVGGAAADKRTEAEISELADTIYVLYEGAVVEAELTGDFWPVRAARKASQRLLDS